MQVYDVFEDFKIEPFDPLADDALATPEEKDSHAYKSNTDNGMRTASNSNNDDTSSSNDSLAHNKIILNNRGQNTLSNKIVVFQTLRII